MKDYRATLFDILNAIDYQRDKLAFVKEFTENIQLQSLHDLLLTLPQDQLVNVKRQLSANSDDASDSSGIIRSYFSESQINSSIENASREAMSSYFEAIRNTLTPQQEKNLLSVIEKYNSAT